MYEQHTIVRTRIPLESWDVLLKIGNDDPLPIGTVMHEDRDHDGGCGYYARVLHGPTLTDRNGWAFDSKRRAVAELVAHHHRTR